MEKDVISGAFFSDNERYADIINGIGCNGIPFVRGKDLYQADTKILSGKRRGLGGKGKRITAKYRDLMRKTAFGMNFAMIGIENQEEIDYALALRVMGYDAGEYGRQAAEIRRQVRRDSKGLSRGEYMYGFRRESCLLPTTTFVLYYGEEAWDGARDLHGLLNFSGIPEELKEKVSNYQLHIVEVRRLESTDMFRTDVKQVFDFIRFSRDKQKIKELLDQEQAYGLLDEEAYDMVAAYAGEGETMFKWKEKHKEGGKVNMCQGIREWLADERMEGRIEGKEEGRAEGILEGKARESERMGRLIVALTGQSRLEDLVKAAEDAEHREKMYKELGI
ncbi:hypothetical protein IMSAGC019_01365 [Lachnospiraceae bacterium]|nr:hypothetical protein IMSAGC019_01365 [Lachnospiraceae bacterium]